MFEEKYNYINDLPRLELAGVFLWFGVDKFVLREFYITWFAATGVKILLPIQDLSLSIYAIGVAEIIMGTFLFAGLKIKLVGIVAGVWEE